MESLPDVSSPEPDTKKSPFDDLTREDLIKKCKGLLVIAQKAKQAKADIQNEAESYKLKLEETLKEKHYSDENANTLQELVNSLTEQKLKFITESDTVKNKLKVLNSKCEALEEQLANQKADAIVKESQLSDLTVKLNNLDSESVSLKRQNNRLVEENEQLINQLTELESKIAEFNKIGLEQREQLCVLEAKVNHDVDESIALEELANKVKELEMCVQTKENTVKECQEKYNSLEQKLRESKNLYENEKEQKEKANIKLRIYKDKISKCAACINQLKNAKYILRKTVKEYSDSIPKWQNEIIVASQFLDAQINKMSDENKILREKLNELERKIDETCTTTDDNVVLTLKQQIDALTTDNNKLITELQSLQPSYENICNVQLPNLLKENNFFKEKINELADSLDKVNLSKTELQEKVNELETKNNELQKSLQKFKDNNNDEKLKLRIKALESENSSLIKDNITAKDCKEKNKIMNEELTILRADYNKLNVKYQNLLQEQEITINNLKSENNNNIDKLKLEIKAAQDRYDAFKKEFDHLNDYNALLREEVETLKCSLERPAEDNENLSEHIASLQTDIVKLETKLAAYKQENGSLLAEMKESRIKVKEAEQMKGEYEESKTMLATYKTENTELLNEMKEINQVLKERGEAISKLQKAVSEMERLIETLEKDRDNVSKEKENLLQKIASMENDLRNAEKKTTDDKEMQSKVVAERDDALKAVQEKDNVIASLRDEIEKIKHNQIPAGEYPNEDMSTSTISKAEEHSRMKDLDDSFEEKYTKLRIFALKLKKKLNETLAQLQKSEQEKAQLETTLKEIQNDPKLLSQDEVDKGIPKTEACNVNNEQIAILEEKVQSLSLALEAAEKSMAELDKVKTELANTAEQLKAETEAHNTTKINLDKVRREVKKKSVLSLELEDYEKSLKDLTTKMEDAKKKMVQMESTIDTQQNTITAMKTQIKLLEEQIKSEENQNRLTKEELHKAQEQIKDKNVTIQNKNEIISKLERDIEDEKRKNENAALEITTLISEKEKVIMYLQEEKMDLLSKFKKSEFHCADLNEKLKATVIELDDLKTDYASYKVRAQAVLRQNQTVDHSQEELLKEEAAAVKAQLETVSGQLKSAKEQCRELQSTVEAERRRASDAISEAGRAANRTARLQADLTRLTTQLETERTQHKLQVSTLTQCYKTQINELEVKLQKETEEFKHKLNKAAERTQFDIVNRNETYMLPVIPKDDSDGDLDINLSMLPREDGEGSEAAPSPPLSKSFLVAGGSRSPVPLERLLEEGVPEDESLDATSLGLTTEQEITDLKRKLQSQQQRVKHVTLLLSESERECARYAQMCDLLKAEVRRARGSLERTEHAHNAEYMKNVTMKFLTLPPGDERSRLVPVLQKILTLTSDETQKLNSVAKGIDPNAARGWGSYLPWPAGK